MSLRPLLPFSLALIPVLQLAGPVSATPQDGEPTGEAVGDEAEVEDSAPETIEEENAWEAIDAELRDLDREAMVERTAPEIWGYGRANVFKKDVGNQTATNLDNFRLNVTGNTLGAAFRVTADFAEGTAVLQDAWMSAALGETVHVTFGQFKIPMLRSGLIEARDLLFIARTRNGVFYSRRDQGAMLNGDHGRLHWSAAVQNGFDSVGNKVLATAHVSVNAIGAPPLPWEGALEAEGGTRLTLGAGVSDDGAGGGRRRGRAYSIELYGIYKGVHLQAEWLDYGSDYNNPNVPNFLEQRGSTSPYSITASTMVVPERYELALRFDDFDDTSTPLDFDRRSLTVGINRYIQGHEIKWQLNYVKFFNDGANDGPDDSILALGLTASF